MPPSAAGGALYCCLILSMIIDIYPCSFLISKKMIIEPLPDMRGHSNKMKIVRLNKTDTIDKAPVRCNKHYRLILTTSIPMEPKKI